MRDGNVGKTVLLIVGVGGVLALALAGTVYWLAARAGAAPPGRADPQREVRQPAADRTGDGGAQTGLLRKAASPGPDPDAGSALQAEGAGSARSLDQPEAGVPPGGGEVDPLPDTEAAALVVRAFDLMSQGTLTGDGWQPPAALWDVVEHNLTTGTVPPALSLFYNRVMRSGAWEVVGTALPVRRLGEPRMVRGRVVDTRELYLLVRSSPGDETEWFQVKVRVDFLHYLDGRVLISQGTLGVVEISWLDPELVPRYRAVHGASE